MSKIPAPTPVYEAHKGMEWSCLHLLIELVDKEWSTKHTTTKFASYSPSQSQANFSLTWPNRKYDKIPVSNRHTGHRIMMAAMYVCN